MLGSSVLKRWRENYYGSTVLAAVAKPVNLACRELSRQIEKKVKKNGATISLPNGRTMRIARDAGVGMASLLLRPTAGPASILTTPASAPTPRGSSVKRDSACFSA